MASQGSCKKKAPRLVQVWRAEMFSLARVSKFRGIWWCFPSSFSCHRILCSRGVEQLSAFHQLQKLPPWSCHILWKVLLLLGFFFFAFLFKKIIFFLKNYIKLTYIMCSLHAKIVTRRNTRVNSAVSASAASSQRHPDVHLVSELQI